MTALCKFCDQQYANAQAVRAHLKGCAAYQAHRDKSQANDGNPRESRPRAENLGNDGDAIRIERPDQPEKPFDEVQQLRQQVAAERLRLELRAVQDAHAERDQQAASKERERQQQAEQKAVTERMAARDRENAQRLTEDRYRERERREAAENRLRQRRREIIQIVKDQVVGRWIPPIANRSDLKARALHEIESDLSQLPVEDLPHVELVVIAEGIRDSTYREAVEAERSSRERAARRQRLIQQGLDYAARELREVEGLPITDRWRIEGLVREELAGIQGDETTAEIEDWVDEILDNEGVVWGDSDE